MAEVKINIGIKPKKLYQVLEYEVVCNGLIKTRKIKLEPLDLETINFEKITNSLLDAINIINKCHLNE